MVLIYMRHGRDQSENSSTFRHDAKMTKQGREDCRKMTIKLIEEHGMPKVIVTSPFYRTIETAKIMKSMIKRTYKRKIKVIIDTSLGRFFTKEQRVQPEIRPETVNYGPIIDRCPHKMLRRVKEHIRKVLKREYHSRSEVIWCISHGVIIKKLVRSLGQSSPEEVGFLQSFVIRSDLETTRFLEPEKKTG